MFFVFASTRNISNNSRRRAKLHPPSNTPELCFCLNFSHSSRQRTTRPYSVATLFLSLDVRIARARIPPMSSSPDADTALHGAGDDGDNVTLQLNGQRGETNNTTYPPNNADVPKPKRLACMICRKRKLRCDGNRPRCATCTRLGHDCAYDEVRRKSGPKRGYVKALEERLSASPCSYRTSYSSLAHDMLQ